MGGKSSSVKMTNQTTNTNQTQGPEQWVRDEGREIYNDTKGLMETSSKWTPYEGERVADYGSLYGDAKDLITGMNGPDANLGKSQSVYDTLKGTLRPNAKVSDFMNPYTDAVLTPTLRNLALTRQKMQLADQGAATAAGAFGDSRHGFADAETNKSFMDATTDATGRAYADAFDKGQNQLNTERTMYGSLGGAYQQLSNSMFNRNTALSRYLTDFAEKDRNLQQTKDNQAFSDFNEARDRPLYQREQLLKMLTATPHQSHMVGTSQTQGVTREEKPDNTAMGLVGKLAGTAFGSIFGPVGSAIGGSIGGALTGGGGGGGSIDGMTDADFAAPTMSWF